MSSSSSSSSSFIFLDKELFIKPLPKDYNCPVCTGIIRSPYNLSCTHLLCSECFKRCSTVISNKCPLCSTDYRGEHLQIAHFVNKKVWGSQICCPNKKEGCTWKDTLGIEERNLNKHMNECSYTIVNCEQCNKEIRKLELDNHLKNLCEKRKVECEFCQDKILLNEYKEHLNEETKCNSFIFCPYKCTLKEEEKRRNKKRKRIEKKEEQEYTIIHKDKIEKHKKICPLVTIKCSITGCNYMDARQNMKLHYQKNAMEHTELQQKEIQKLKVSVARLEEVAADIQLNQLFSQDIIIRTKIPNISKREGFIRSEPFHFGSYIFTLHIEGDGNNISVVLQIEKGCVTPRVELKVKFFVISEKDNSNIIRSYHSTYGFFTNQQKLGKLNFISQELLMASDAYNREEDYVFFYCHIKRPEWISQLLTI